MKYRVLRILTIILVVGTVFVANKGWEKLMKDQTVQAFGDLIVDFHVPIGNPIFTLLNMKPSDIESRLIDVTNGGSVSRFISTRGIRTGGTGSDPKIETSLLVTIKDGSTPIYGPVTMADFFAQSEAENGVPLNIINTGGNKTYNFSVEFPASAGNLFQAKSVLADIQFGIITAENIVINEVFYNLDTAHGLDAKEKNNEQKYKAQWIELYNPTDQDVSLKNWTVTDNSGKSVIIHPNKKIKAGGFALLSKDASVWRFWNENRRAEKIELGKIIGNGLDLSGDRLILKNKQGSSIDSLSWGSDTSVFSPSVPSVSAGRSSERQAPGLDNDIASDFVDRSAPTPGN